MYDISGTCHLFRIGSSVGPIVLGQNLSKIQIFGAEFGADSRFWGHFLEERTF